MPKFPDLQIRSQNELVKRLYRKMGCLSYLQALAILNHCASSYPTTWRDNTEMSDPEKNKYVRSANPANLKRLHVAVDRVLLKPCDSLILPFIYGGVSKKSHISAARVLITNRGDRAFLKLDLCKFFEQVSKEEVFGVFHGFGCDKKTANVLAECCCVPKGPQANPQKGVTLARGFAPSTRLAVWSNHKFFLEVFNVVRKRLKAHQPRIAIYVADIGITAIDVSRQQLEDLYQEIALVAEKHRLLLNEQTNTRNSWESP